MKICAACEDAVECARRGSCWIDAHGLRPTDNVISLRDALRMHSGKAIKCRHVRYELDTNNRTVHCRDCNAEVSAYEALDTIARGVSSVLADLEAARKEAAELKAYNPFLKAVKRLEGIWRGSRMLPICPHCRRGIEAEALAKTGQVSRRFDVIQGTKIHE